jgi:DNA polymerase-3 subunit gamma/tau
MGLATDHRPQTLDEIYGNQDTVATIRSLLDREDPPHSWLMYGPTGAGKTTIGRILARELGASGDDYREIDTADFRGIDMVRELRKQSQFVPLEGSSRVWLLDECHKLSNDAQNALLKALEDPPDHVYYILCTTDPQKLLPTIRGRCSQHSVTALSEREMRKLARDVAKAEGEKLGKEVLQQIVETSQGLPRDGLQVLDKVLAADPDSRMTIAQQRADQQAQAIELARGLLKGTGWKKISNILNDLKDEDPEAVRRQVLGYFSSVLLGGENDQAAAVMEEFTEPFYNNGFPGLVFACYSAVRGGD